MNYAGRMSDSFLLGPQGTHDCAGLRVRFSKAFIVSSEKKIQVEVHFLL